MKTVLICHEGARLDELVLTRWLASFTDLAGIVLIAEDATRSRARIRRELRRTGLLRFADVLAFRLYYRLVLARADHEWERLRCEALAQSLPELPSSVAHLRVADPNGEEAEAFIRGLAPDVTLARCKVLLHERVFTIPVTGTFVMHPGATPEYRNSHGCFWALARRDLEKVMMTLVRIDAGVDTGPVFGYFGCDYDERRETHIVIQKRVVYDNLDAIAERLLAVHRGAVAPIDTSGRPSATWGQPWLTSYLRWKHAAHTQ